MHRVPWLLVSIRSAALAAGLSVLLFWPMPSSALANPQSPSNDNFLDSVPLNAPKEPLNTVHTLGDVKETFGATLQPNIFSPCGISNCASGPPEMSTCDGVPYGKTIWYDFYPDHDGQVEIRTAGIPNVIALYSYGPRSLLPHELRCAPGSSYASNELSVSVRQGVDYTYQIGGRNSAGGTVQMQFNYAYRSRLTVAPFFMAAIYEKLSARQRQVALFKLKFIGLAHGEKLSFACAVCEAAGFQTAKSPGNAAVFTATSPPVIGVGTRVIVGATAPAQIGRFKLYELHPASGTLSVVAQGCLAPGFDSVPVGSETDLTQLQRVRCPTMFVNPVGGEYAFWRGTDGRLAEMWYDGQRWIRLTVRPGAGGLRSSPSVAVHADGEQDVFWRGNSGNLWETWYTGTWQGPSNLGAGNLSSAPSAGVDAADDEYVFWQGTNGGLWEKSYSSGWSARVPLPFGRLGSAPSVAVHANGEQDVFWKGTNGDLWEAWYTNRWNGPVDRGAGPLGSAPSVAVDAAGNEYVFWQGANAVLWEMSYSGGTWSAPAPLPFGPLGSPPSVAVHANGEQDVFWKGTNGNLLEAWHTNKWNGPKDLMAGRLGSAPGAGVDASGKQSAR